MALSAPDDPVEELLSELLLAPPAGRGERLDALCAAHMGHADELRARWSALAALGLDDLLAPEAPVPERLGDFRLLAELGGGGMGVVHLAEQVSLGRRVALKVMRREGLFVPESRERFRREVEAIARLDHPGIVKVHTVGEDQGIPYFAMERIDGRTLAEVIDALAGRAPATLTGADLARAVAPQGGAAGALFQLSWPDACTEIGRRAAEALEHAHGHGIVHRDVKPSNVAVTRDARVQLFDFGLSASSEVDRLTRTGGQLGTLHYMSPEQVRGERELDARSDVYALGVTLYELLALATPFEGDSRHAIEARILESRPVPLRTLNRRVPQELERVVAKAMEVDRARRYPTAAALADDLRRVLERRPVDAQPPGPWLRARRWAQRRPAHAVALVAGIGLFVVTPTVLLWRERLHSEALRDALTQESLALAEARAAFGFVEGLFLSSDPYRSAGPDKRVRDLLLEGIASLDGLEESPRMEARLRLGLASSCFAHSLFEEALPLARRALELEDELGEPILCNDIRPLEVVVHALEGLARFDEAEALLVERLRDGALMDEAVRAKMRFELGTVRTSVGRYAEAEPDLRAALAAFTDMAERGLMTERQAREADMSIRWRLATALGGLERHEEALTVAEPTIEAARSLYPEAHPAIAESTSQTAFCLAGLGDHGSALALQREATATIEGYYGPESFASFRFHSDLANLLGKSGDYGEGVREAETVVRIGEGLFPADDPRNTEARRVLAAYRSLTAHHD